MVNADPGASDQGPSVTFPKKELFTRSRDEMVNADPGASDQGPSVTFPKKRVVHTLAIVTVMFFIAKIEWYGI